MIRFAAVNLNPNANGPDYPNLVKTLEEDDEARVNFLKACLTKLGLTVSEDAGAVPSLSRLHLSSQHNFLIPELLASWEDIITTNDGEEYIKGENDTFHLEKQSSRWSLNTLERLAKSLNLTSTSDVAKSGDDTANDSRDKHIDYNAILKRLIPHEIEWPGTKETPYFNHYSFYANLKKYQEESHGEAEEFGKYILYGEVLTSTNTILEKYKPLSTPVVHRCSPVPTKINSLLSQKYQTTLTYAFRLHSYSNYPSRWSWPRFQRLGLTSRLLDLLNSNASPHGIEQHCTRSIRSISYGHCHCARHPIIRQRLREAPCKAQMAQRYLYVNTIISLHMFPKQTFLLAPLPPQIQDFNPTTNMHPHEQMP